MAKKTSHADAIIYFWITLRVADYACIQLIRKPPPAIKHDHTDDASEFFGGGAY